jgi:hypothetical protein
MIVYWELQFNASFIRNLSSTRFLRPCDLSLSRLHVQSQLRVPPGQITDSGTCITASLKMNGFLSTYFLCHHDPPNLSETRFHSQLIRFTDSDMCHRYSEKKLSWAAHQQLL